MVYVHFYFFVHLPFLDRPIFFFVSSSLLLLSFPVTWNDYCAYLFIDYGVECLRAYLFVCLRVYLSFAKTPSHVVGTALPASLESIVS